MKGKKFYFLLIGLILIGIGSIFFYRQREEQRVLEFEGYEIATIENRVEGLYNEEKTDLAQAISDEELEELEIIFEELDEKSLSRRSRDRIRDMQLAFLIAESMLETERDVEEIFVERNIVDKDLTEDNIDELEADVLAFENMPVYVDRNIELLAYARQQVVAINRATEFVNSLFDEEENILESVTREDEEEALELIDPILNNEVKEQLTLQVEQVKLVLTEREEQLALEEALQQQLEEEEIQEVEELEEEVNEVEESQNTSPPAPTTPPAQSWTPPAQTWRPPRNPGTGGNGGGSDEGETDDSKTDDSNGSTNSGTEDDNGTEGSETPVAPGNGEDEIPDEGAPEENGSENPTWESQY